MKIIVTEKFGPDGVLQERVSEYIGNHEIKKDQTESHPRKKLNRNLNLYFKPQQEIRIKQYPNFIGKYDEERNQIEYNGKYFKSLNAFLKEKKKVQVNAWDYCECKQDNDTWILCRNLPTIEY